MLSVLRVAAALLALCTGAGAQDAAQSPNGPQRPKITPPMKVRVIDARTFSDLQTGETFRLFAIDVCAIDQPATLDGQPWPCGVVSTAWLVQATLGQWVICNRIRSQPETTLARCATARQPDLADAMIRDGIAVVIHDPEIATPAEYNQFDAEARRSFRGIWRSQFQMPREYRAQATAVGDGDRPK